MNAPSSAARLPSGARLEIHETLGSTSAEAMARAAEGETGPLWILARLQTAGYGRRGTAWRQTAGDLAATLLFQPRPSEGPTTRLGFAAGLAIAEALEATAPGARARLKWPNDAMLPLPDGRFGKAGGLLVETAAPATLALGIGINLVGTPPDAPYLTARLADLAPPPAPEALLARIDAHLAAWRARLSRDGFAPLRAAWQERAWGVGAPARLVTSESVAAGVFAGLDESGAALLDTPAGRQAFVAGSLVFDASPAADAAPRERP